MHFSNFYPSVAELHHSLFTECFTDYLNSTCCLCRCSLSFLFLKFFNFAPHDSTNGMRFYWSKDGSLCLFQSANCFRNICYSESRILSILSVLHLIQIHWDLDFGNFIELKHCWKATGFLDWFDVGWTFNLARVEHWSHFIVATALKLALY